MKSVQWTALGVERIKQSQAFKRFAKVYHQLPDRSRQSVMWLILVLVLAMLAGMWVLSSLNLEFSQKTLSEVRYQQIEETFRKGLGRIESRQLALQASTQTLAKQGESFYRLSVRTHNASAVRGELERALQSHLQTFKGVSGAGFWFEPGIFSASNAAYATTGVLNRAGQFELKRDNRHYRLQDWFKRIHPRNAELPFVVAAQTYWTPVYFDLSLERAQLTLAAPMFDDQNRLIGMVTTDWTADSIIELVSHFEVTADSFSFLLDRNNRKLSSLSRSDDTLAAQRLIEEVLALKLTDRAELMSAFDAQALPGQQLAVVDGRGYELLYAATPAGMVFGVGVPQDEIDAVLVPLRSSNHAILLVTALVLLAVSVYLVRRIYRLMLDLRAAYTDPLTQLPNRAQLLLDLQKPLGNGLILFNIDHFKEANSLFGQACGDRILLSLANALQAEVAQAKNAEALRVYRLPGDEFALLGRFATAEALVDKTRQLYARLGHWQATCQEQTFEVDVTGGLVFNQNEQAGMQSDKLLTQANIALREARQHSRNFELFDSSQSPEQRYEQNMHWAKQVRLALAEDRILPFFQPIFDNKAGRITKYECLIRMQDTQGDFISPGVFLDISHRLRLDRQLTAIMIEKCFAFFKDQPYAFSINLSYSDLTEPAIVALIEAQLQATPIGSRVIFEILESDGIQNYRDVLHFIDKVKAYGCKVAIDDFGTGYSNFEHLLRLKVDIIKIDGSLIKTIDQDANAFQVTAGLAAFAHRLGIEVVAEFVHNQAVQQRVAEIGIDFSQGAYFGMPKAHLLVENPTEVA